MRNRQLPAPLAAESEYRTCAGKQFVLPITVRGKMPRKKAGKTTAEAPTLSCLLICDDVLMSVAGAKHMLHGVIDRIVVTELPAQIGPCVAYVRLSNVYSNQHIVLSFCRASTDEEVFRFDAKSPGKSDPLGTHTLILKIPGFAVEQPGRYIFSASHGGMPFAQSPITIQLIEKAE
jgi:hypothetical protein